MPRQHPFSNRGRIEKKRELLSAQCSVLTAGQSTNVRSSTGSEYTDPSGRLGDGETSALVLEKSHRLLPDLSDNLVVVLLRRAKQSGEGIRLQPLIIVSEMKGKERTIHFQASKGDRPGKRDRSGCSIDGHIIQAKRNEDER
jgi:hypothetical protein